jgi:hypothetical protein
MTTLSINKTINAESSVRLPNATRANQLEKKIQTVISKYKEAVEANVNSPLRAHQNQILTQAKIDLLDVEAMWGQVRCGFLCTRTCGLYTIVIPILGLTGYLGLLTAQEKNPYIQGIIIGAMLGLTVLTCCACCACDVSADSCASDMCELQERTSYQLTRYEETYDHLSKSKPKIVRVSPKTPLDTIVEIEDTLD